MASIERRSDRPAPGKTWRARYRDAGGQQHSRSFERKADAQRWLNEATAGMVTGTYVDPRAGRVAFREYAEHWRSIQNHRPSTVDVVERHLRNHVYPVIGSRPLETLLPSDLRGLVKSMSLRLAPATVTLIWRHVSAIMKAAVGDRKIATSPCTGISVPRARTTKVVPLPSEAVLALADAMSPRHRALVIVASATGLRQGELLGLTVDRIDFLRRKVAVDRQLVSVAGSKPSFGPLKTDASYRTVPLPQLAIDTLAAHLAEFPVGEDGLVFTSATGLPARRSTLHEEWAAAVRTARRTLGEPLPERVVFHDLRHFYASLLIRFGESVKTVQARLGHASAAETLDTYSHLWPDSDDRTREAVDAGLGRVLASQVRPTAASAG